MSLPTPIRNLGRKAGLDLRVGLSLNRDLTINGGSLVWDSTPASNSVIEIPDDNAFSFTDGAGNDDPCSFFARINMRDATRFRIVSKFNNTGDREFGFFTTGGDLLFMAFYDTTNQQTAVASVTDFSTFENELISVLATYDGSNGFAGIMLYKDGLALSVTDESSGVYTGITNTTEIVRIGMLEGFSSADGQLSQIRVIAGELTAAQALTLHNDNTHPLTDVAHWTLDGDAKDSSSNGHNGTNNNGTFVPPS